MSKITILDGATGTMLWQMAEADGVAKVPVWIYSMEHPEYVERVAKAYIEAGSDIILSNTFGANGPSVRKSSSYDPAEVVRTGVRIAKQAAEGTSVKVGLDIGPLSELMEPYGDLEEDEVAEIYTEMMRAGVEAGADLIFLETFIDLNMMAVAAQTAVSFGVPVLCSMSFEKSGKTIMGNSPKDVAETLAPLGVSAVGINCSLGPDQALPILKAYSEATDLPLIFKPNAGMPILTPDGKSVASVDAIHFVDDVAPALPYVSYVGGCCGSAPLYIEKLKERVASL
ncbi:MAG: homocysteine S-methyltransferase family protein [Clostridia bacterium]|nr:homocysteine S-methyltransferase family protein [Clostridia bacterium]